MNTNTKVKAAAIHERAVKASKMHLSSERDLVQIFQELDAIRGYLFYAANSLYDYGTRVLGLSDSSTYNLINVARKARTIPVLQAAVISGEVSISKARKIVPVITKQNAETWIAIAKGNTSREIERAAAAVNPQLAVKESARFVADDRVEFKCGLSAETLEKLRRVADLESQRTRKAVKNEGAIDAALDAYLEKFDPVKKAERSQARSAGKAENAAPSTAWKAENAVISSTRKSEYLESRSIGSFKTNSETLSHQLVPGQVGGSVAVARKRYIPSVVRHAVYMRDQGRCTYKSVEGDRCTAKLWVDFHHVIRPEDGGADSVENLVTLCGSHHRLTHFQIRNSTVREIEIVYH